MSIEKEQFEKVMAELRRACLPAGGADAVQAYVDSLAGDLARVQASVATLATAGRGAWTKANAAQAQLAEVVGLLKSASQYQWQFTGDSLGTTRDREKKDADRACLLEHVGTFLARHAQAEQQEAPCEYCDDTGDVHRPDGEWLGTCPCPAGQEAQGQAVGDRARAEQAYVESAFDYSSAPIGSRDWTLYWNGWQHRAALATQPAATAWRVVDKAGKRFTIYHEDIAKFAAEKGLQLTPMCDLPPEGWECSRTPGHEGPCAASAATQPAAIKLPDRKQYNGLVSTAENLSSVAWNQCLDAVQKLNAVRGVDHE